VANLIFESLLPIATLVLIAVGHIGICIGCYNRINATGIKRTTLKRLEKIAGLILLAIPIGLLSTEAFRLGTGGLVSSLLQASWGRWSMPTVAYCSLAIAVAVIVGPFWILDRPLFTIAWNRFRLVHSHVFNHPNVDETTLQQYVCGRMFQRMARLPCNQIASLECNRKSLLIDRLPIPLHGLRIAHLSDIHLTSKMAIPFYRLAVEWVMEQKPHVIIISGDIVDYAIARDEQLGPFVDGLSAPLGEFFVLGNHDRRLTHPLTISDALVGQGWTDLGAADAVISKGISLIRLMGNERPWFHRNLESERSRPEFGDSNAELRLGVSHSPDQFNWGVQQGCSLMLCGHTHGGQIRFPWIGPVIAPSWYGSRYASGVFLRNRTLMHVSRGISAVHPFRWGCLPEVSILQLEPAVS
jgi:uncharacterized protein